MEIEQNAMEIEPAAPHVDDEPPPPGVPPEPVRRPPPCVQSQDLLAHTAAFMDAADIARLSFTCRFVPEHVGDPRTVAFVASMRGGALDRMTTLERVALAESVIQCQTSIAFEFRSVELVAAAYEPLDRFAAVLRRHNTFAVSIEAHCGLEAPRSLGYGFSRDRARSVARALIDRGVEAARLSVVSWSNSKPLVWAFGEPAGSANRRVELYVRGDGFEVPRRRADAEYARPPDGAQRWDSDSDEDGTPAAAAPPAEHADDDARALDGIDDGIDDDVDDDFLEAMLNSEHGGIQRLAEAGIQDVESLRRLIEEDRPLLLRLLFGAPAASDADSETESSESGGEGESE
mmetsp:Transcript_22016/g.65996  ORF Transcript_22016/g.65996 Transcript_22016/m.65996 type:complete len:346 (-) Transcript_22016:41-1078(-)